MLLNLFFVDKCKGAISRVHTMDTSLLFKVSVTLETATEAVHISIL